MVFPYSGTFTENPSAAPGEQREVSGYRGSDRYGDGGTVLRPVEVPVAPLAIDPPPSSPVETRARAAGEGGRRERGRRRLLKWGRPNLHRPALLARSRRAAGRAHRHPGPARTASQVIVGKVESVRDTPAGLEATIRLKDNAEGAETAHEMADGYLPAVELLMQSLTKDPRDFRPRARVLGLQLGTIADPSGDDGRVLSVNGVRVPPSDPEELDAKPVRPVKPRALIEAEELLIEAGQGSSWWANVGG